MKKINTLFISLILICCIGIAYNIYGNAHNLNTKLAEATDRYELEKAEYEQAEKELLEIKLEIAKKCLVDLRQNFDEAKYKDCKNGYNGIRQVTERLGRKYTPRYYVPQDLFYTFLEDDGVYVSQSYRDHYKNNGLLAVDIATSGRPLIQYAPDLYNKEVEWTVSISDFPHSTGKTIELIGESKKVLIGHVKHYLVEDGDIVKTGDPIIITGGDKEDEGKSTGLHAHIEYYQWDGDKNDWSIFEYTFKQSNKHVIWQEQAEVREEEFKDNMTIQFTTYNAEEAQTDGNPCQGAWGNVCELYEQGKNPIALSRDLIQATSDVMIQAGYCTENCPFNYGDIVTVTPIDHWQGEFKAIVSDTMNKRFTLRGDLFKKDRAHNTSFKATITNNYE